MTEQPSVSALERLKPLLADPKEILQLENLLKEKDHPIVYDVVEPHGSMHLPQAFMKGLLLKTLAEAGFTVVLYIADWISFLHSLLLNISHFHWFSYLFHSQNVVEIN